MPRALWRKDGRISSSKSVPQIEVLTFAEADAGEPVWTMKVGRERWKGEESYAEEAQRAKKFWRPLTTSVRSSTGMTGACLWKLGCESQWSYFCSLGHWFAKDFDFDVTKGSMESHRHGW